MKAKRTRSRLASVAGLLAVAVAAPCIVAAGCTTPDASRAPGVDGGSAAPSGSAVETSSAPAPAAPPTDSPGSDELHPVYPVDGGPPDPLAQRFCDAIYALPARRAAECCSTAPSIGAAFAGQCVRVLSYAMSTHAVRLASADVDACAEAIEKATVGCDWVTLKLSVPIPPACDGILEGQLHDKAPCRSSLECADGLRCQGLSSIDVGACGPPRPAGQACNLAVDMLASFTRQDHYPRKHPECEGYCSGMRCQPTLPEGGACKGDAPCGKLRCEGGKCTAAPLPGAGAACSADCAGDLRCIDGKCSTPRAGGEACKTDVECRGRCVPGDGGVGGTCDKTCTMVWPTTKAPPPKAPPPPRQKR
jgi:hypothetical protein